MLKILFGLRVVFAVAFVLLFTGVMQAHGTWMAVTDTAPNLNNGVMLLLTDGSVITITINDPNAVVDDSAGPVWNKLTPDSTGSYANGKWSVIAPMNYSRIYFSSQVLQNGKVYVAGGEFGTGSGTAELYDPIADRWDTIPGIPSNYHLQDANSQMLPDGRVLQNSIYGTGGDGTANMFYDPVTNAMLPAPACGYSDDEASWLKLPDNSILYEATNATNTQRYIPALNAWVLDNNTPVNLYDAFGIETGPAVMLPDGRGLFFGSNSYTAYYTPTGGTSAGQWALGPQMPNGLGMPDAPAAMMADGHILLALAQKPDGIIADSIFHPTSYFYEFDYTTNTYTPLPAPTGGQSVNQPSCSSVMLCLPDGTVLLGIEGSSQYYIYTPGNPPLAAGKPTVDTVTEADCRFMITGKLFNGISQGAAYGDDWQMATNYPMVRLIANGKTYYASTTNWNRTGIQTRNLADTAYFTVPSNAPTGNYALVLSANGISADTFNFAYAQCSTGVPQIGNPLQVLLAIPNPAHQQTTLRFTADVATGYTVALTDMLGRQVLVEDDKAAPGVNTHTLQLRGLAAGVYIAGITIGNSRYVAKVMVE